MRTLLGLAFSLLLIVSASGGEITARAGWAIDNASKKMPPREVVNIEFSENGNPEGGLLDLKKGAPLKTDSYQLIASKSGAADQAVGIAQVIPNGGIDDNTATSLIIVPKEPPKTDYTYTLKVLSEAWEFAGKATFENSTGKEFKLGNDKLELDLTYVSPRSLHTKIDLSGGTAATGSLQYNLDLTQYTGDTLWSADVLGKADFTLVPKDKDKYLNSLVGQVKAFGAGVWNPNNENFTGFAQIGLTARVESDQSFETVDGTLGAGAGSYIKNPITSFLQENIIYFLQGKKIQEAGVAPYLYAGYDYVDHWKSGVSNGTGNNRARFEFDWSCPLLRGFDFPKELGLTGQVFDADFIADVEVIYDFRKSEAMDNSKLTVEFRPQTPSDKAPSFTLTYAQGKATPTFQHFDAFLAGIKLPF